MKKLLLTAILTIGLAFPALAGDPVLDLTSDASFRESGKAISASLDAQTSTAFDQAMMKLIVAQITPDGTLFSGLQVASAPGFKRESLRPKLQPIIDGKTAAEVIDLAKTVELK